MAPATQYAKTSEGLIAYQVFGDGPRDLVYLTGATSHVDVRWESPQTARFLERLASFCRVILFDRRGIGASDPVTLDALPPWEEWSEDLRVVLDAAGSDKAVVFAMLDAGGMALLHAASHPDRTSALVLGNTTAKWVAADNYPEGWDQEAAQAFINTLEDVWGTEAYAALTLPAVAEDPQALAWFAKYMRAGASPRVAAAHLRASAAVDLREVLSLTSVPTMVIHRRGFGLIPLEQGRFLSENIPGATFVELEGSDSSFAFGDSNVALDAIEEFITGVKPQADPDRALATVLITDLVESTLRATELGDRRWRDLLNRHDEVARSHIDNHRGRLRKMTGDGVLATFDAPGRAIHCARALAESLTSLGLAMRAGLHTGELELRGEDVGGIAVHIAARVAALAGPGEILVSRTVTDLVVGSEITFEDRGKHSLRGVPGDWQLFAAAV